MGQVKFSRVKVCEVVVYGLTEWDLEERDRFWNDLDRVVDRAGNGYRLGVLGNLNEWVGDKMRVNITGGFGALGKMIMEGVI